MESQGAIWQSGCIVAILLIFSSSGCSQTTLNPSLFQCQSSSDGSGQVYTPNIPDFYFNDANAANFRTGRHGVTNLTTASEGAVYIFTVPPESAERNCTGIATAIQYCFETYDKKWFAFTVTGTFLVQSIPQNSFCTEPQGGFGLAIFCCHTVNIKTTNRFQLASSSYTFALAPVEVQPLAFADTATDYRYDQFIIPIENSTGAGTFQLGQNRVTDRSLLLLRFLIEPTPDPTAKVMTRTMAITEPGSTMNPESQGTADPETPTAGVFLSSSGIFLGVMVGMVILAVFLIIAIIVTVLVFQKQKRSLLEVGVGDTPGAAGDRRTGAGPDAIYRKMDQTTSCLQQPLSTNPAHGVITDGVAVSTNPVTTDIAVSTNPVTTDGVAVSTNPVTTDGVAVSTINQAYGVTTDEVAVSTNPAYGVTIDGSGVAISTNPAHGVTIDGEAVHEYDYIEVKL